MARKEANEYLLKIIKQMPNGEMNHNLYSKALPKISDARLNELATEIDNGTFIWPLYNYNMDKERIDVDKVMDIGTKEGVKWFQKLVITDPITGKEFKTPVEYMIVNLPVRRAVQHLVKKLSTSDGMQVDHLTGQPTGNARAAGISGPELSQIVNARNLTTSALELIKVRGGDAKAHANMRDQIKKTGTFTMGPIMDLDSRPKSLETLRSFLLGLHLRPEGID